MFTYEFDIHKKELISDCNIYPTEINNKDQEWLYAINNKYITESIDPEKIGKWMVFLSGAHINEAWDKIKKAVASGELWHTKVSTNNPAKVNSHVIIIYTKDYTDLNDVIRVLDYIESSDVKSPDRIIKYKTNQQTFAGIYSGDPKQKPWIYSSDTMREIAATEAERQRNNNTRS